MRLVSLFALLGATSADFYMHNPAGGNDRNRERNQNRNNGNRLFDSQNNGNGGYPWRGDASLRGAADPMVYYEGSVLPTEWTLQVRRIFPSMHALLPPAPPHAPPSPRSSPPCLPRVGVGEQHAWRCVCLSLAPTCTLQVSAASSYVRYTVSTSPPFSLPLSAAHAAARVRPRCFDILHGRAPVRV